MITILSALQISNMAKNQNDVNILYRLQDESHLFPIKGKFNVTKCAIRRLQKAQREGLIFDNLYSYALTLDTEISEIVNNEKNW